MAQYAFSFKLKKQTQILLFRDYLGHFIRNPHSLIVKIFGVFSVKLKKGRKKVHFILMQSVFYPDDKINWRFDIKVWSRLKNKPALYSTY